MNRDLVIFAISYFLWGIGEGMFLYFQPVYLQQLGADPVLIGTILGAMGVAMTVSQIPAGYLADRFGRRPFIWASWLLGSAAVWVMALAGDLTLFTVGLLLYSFSAFGSAAQNSYIAKAGEHLDLGRTLTLIWAVYFFSATAGSIIGGVIGEAYGLKTVYLIAAIVLIFPSLLILFLRRQAVEHSIQDKSRPHLVKNRAFLTLMAVIFLSISTSYLAFPLAPNYLQNQHHVSLGEIGQLGAIGSLGTVIILLVGGRLRPRLAFMVGQMIMGVFALMLLLGTNMIWFGVAYFCLGGFRLARSMTPALGKLVVRPSEMGLAFGLIESVNGLAVILAPILAGELYRNDPQQIFSVALIGMAFSISVYLGYLLLLRKNLLAEAHPSEIG